MRLVVPLLLAAGGPVSALSLAPARPHDVWSPNRAYILVVDPITQVHTVYAAGDRTRPLWSLTGGGQFFVLADDGRAVAVIAPAALRPSELGGTVGVRFWTPEGVRRSYPVLDLCPDPLPLPPDPDGWPVEGERRTWYEHAERKGESFVIRTPRRVEYEFRIADGALIGQRRVGLPTWAIWAAICGGLVAAAGVGAWVWRGRRTSRLHRTAADRLTGR